MPTPAAEFSGYAFTGARIDRADPLRHDATALAGLWPRARVLVLDHDGCAYCDDHGQWWPLRGDALGGGPGTAIFLGLLDDEPVFCVDAERVNASAPGRIDLRRAAASWPAELAQLFAYARGMSYWQSRTRYCGVCGGQVEFARGGFVGHCADCNTEHYPRVDPAVIAAVHHRGHLLLGRQPGWAPRRYSVLAGFVEPGETLEQTVVREVHEEAKVRVLRAHYLGAQPWPFPGGLMLGFHAEAAFDTPQVDGELEDARWCSREEVGAALAREHDDDGQGILLPPPISIARSLIEYWYRHLSG